MKRVYLTTFLLLAFFYSTGWADSKFLELCMDGSLSEVSFAIENGANVNERASDSWTALMLAIMENRDPRVSLALIKAGANINTTNALGWTPLIIAAIHNPNVEVTKALIEAGADVNAKGRDGTTALSVAKNPEIISILTNVVSKTEKQAGSTSSTTSKASSGWWSWIWEKLKTVLVIVLIFCGPPGWILLVQLTLLYAIISALLS